MATQATPFPYSTRPKHANLASGNTENMRKIVIAVLTALTLLAFPPPAIAYVDPTTGAPGPGRVLRAFDKPEHNWLPGHRGVDMQLEVGDTVHAAGDGVVAFVGMVAGTPVLSIDHADGIRTTYQPVRARVAQGDRVHAGQEIGTLAPPTDGWPGLHWGAKRGKDYLNPLSLLAEPHIRLKPVAA